MHSAQACLLQFAIVASRLCSYFCFETELSKGNDMKNGIFKKLFPTVRSRYEREQDYLNQSVSARDLDRRIREINKGLFH